MSVIDRSTRPHRNTLRRIMGSMLGQRRKTLACPKSPSLQGLNVLITGGASGVGEFVSRGLIARGAQVTSAARGLSKSTSDLPGLTSLCMDLGDPASVTEAAEQLDHTPFDILIFNAGINSVSYTQTSYGMEKTYAVNVFGHHLLFRLLESQGLIKDGARIIFTTGDIYVLADDCAHDFEFKRGPMAYARSKLGNLWQVQEIARRYPQFHPIAVHPGVVASGFAGAKHGITGWLKNQMFISEESGAQSALIAATQDLARGAYWHNVYGAVDLDPSDIALNAEKSERFWNNLDTMTKPFLQ